MISLVTPDLKTVLRLPCYTNSASHLNHSSGSVLKVAICKYDLIFQCLLMRLIASFWNMIQSQ